MKIHEALSAVMADVRSIGKGDKNDFHNFVFRGVDRVLNNVGPALRQHGVVVTPELRDLQSRDVTTSKGAKQREVTVIVAYVFTGPEGDYLTAVVPGEAADAGDKAVSKAMSVAMRTALIQALTIPTGEKDPDQHTVTRGVDPTVKVKNEIWAEAEKRGWIQEDNFERLADEFAQWSQGQDIRDADEKLLREYLAHLRPKKTMQRGQQQ